MKKILLIFSVGIVNIGFSQTMLTHSSNQAVWSANAGACTTSGPGTIHNNSFIRVYDTDDFNVQDTVFLISIELGVESASGGAYNLVGRVHELNGTLLFANMSLIVDDTAAIYPDSSIYKMKIPFDDDYAYALPGDTLVTEVFAAINAAITFFPGSNPYLESDDSYIAALGCGIPEPVTFSSIAFTTTHLLLNLWVNHRPAMDDFSAMTFKDNALFFNKADFDFEMIDFDYDTVGMIQILTLPTNGMLENNGTAISIGDTVLSSELDVMTYTPNAGFFGFDNFDFRVRDNSHWALDSTHIDITVMNWQLGVEENKKEEFVIYPNPTNSSFEIKSKEKIELIQIYSATGRLLETIPATTNLIDVSTYATGTYFVVLTTEKGMQVQKLMKE